MASRGRGHRNRNSASSAFAMRQCCQRNRNARVLSHPRHAKVAYSRRIQLNSAISHCPAPAVQLQPWPDQTAPRRSPASATICVTQRLTEREAQTHRHTQRKQEATQRDTPPQPRRHRIQGTARSGAAGQRSCSGRCTRNAQTGRQAGRQAGRQQPAGRPAGRPDGRTERQTVRQANR